MKKRSESTLLDGATARVCAREFQRATGRDARQVEKERLKARILDAHGRVRDEFLVERPCPTCAATERALLFAKGGVDYERCRACGLIYVARYVSHEGRRKTWAEERPTSTFYLSPMQRDFDVPKFRHGAQLLVRHGLEGAPVLDVGTASGLFLEVLRDERVRGVGIEALEGFYAEAHRESGLDVRYGTLESLAFDAESFGAVTFWDCLEHVIDPAAALDQSRELLVPGGLLLVLVPNAGSLAARVMRERCAMFDGVEHINMYTPRTLRESVEARGFRLLHEETIIPEINVLNNYLDYEDPYTGPSAELERVLGLAELDGEFLKKKLLGYKLLALFGPAESGK